MDKSNSRIVIIDCYTDHVEKVNILRKCIESLKPLNIHLMIVSHTPIPEDIIKSANYYIYDYDNTFSDVFAGSYWWMDYPSYYLHVNARPPFFPTKGHEYPIIRSMRNSISLADVNKYETFCFLEFDNIFTEKELVAITEIFDRLDRKSNKFLFFEGGDNDSNKYFVTMLFAGYTSEFLATFNSYFPHTIEEYNKIFPFKYPFNLERFFYEMFRDRSNEFKTLPADMFGTYFDGGNKNISHISDGKSWILSDHNENYYLILSNHSKIRYKIKIKYNNQILHENQFSEYTYPALKLEQEGVYMIEYFSSDDILLKNNCINFDLKNKEDYIKQGSIKIK